MPGDKNWKLLCQRHQRFLQRCISILPSSTVSFDTSRMTVFFFALSGLDLLQGLDVFKEEEVENMIKWIYSLQVIPTTESDDSTLSSGGFKGGSSIPILNHDHPMADLHCGHIAMTYTALASLVILGDDLSKVDKPAVLRHVSSLQCSDGSFYSTAGGSENDMRFLYCAATVCYILKDFSAINTKTAINYIKNSLTFEGAFGQGVNQEAHGGSTFCAVASLYLMGMLDTVFTPDENKRLVKWLVARQDDEGGLQGRPNKPSDTCYTYWVGGSLKLLNSIDHLDLVALQQFVLSTQDPITGGLAKYYDTFPDGLHTYLGLSGLSILGLNQELRPVDPALNISRRALEHLKCLHRSWS